MNEATANRIRTELKRIDSNNEYYAITLLCDEDGHMIWTTITHWVGWVNDEPGREIRKASIVNPDGIIEIWTDIGESYIVVNDISSFVFFFRLGGHGLVERNVAEHYLADIICAEETAFNGALGFKNIKNVPSYAFKKAPTPKHRMRILKRDDFKCRLCGRSPSNYTDVELHLHHIRPWSRGGLTENENLITVCHTCHKGLDPHEDHYCFFLIDDKINKEQFESQKDYYDSVNRHRKKVHEAFEVLGSNK